jgi:alpha-tubulin suppressor-like RCC1 family protein
VTTTKQAYCWGYNSSGELGVASTSGPQLCVDDGDTIPCSMKPAKVSGGSSWAAVSAGYYHTCGVTTTGQAYCWGTNHSGELGGGPTGTAFAPVTVAGGLTFATVSASHAYHSCGVTTSGQAYCWGNNVRGQLGNGSYDSTFAPVAVVGGLTFTNVSGGDYLTCGLATTGQAYCWGDHSYGALGNGPMPPAQITAPGAVNGGLTLASVSAGFHHTCGLTTDGKAYCWGDDSWGQLGDGSTAVSWVPVAVSGGLTFTSVSAGGRHTCGVTTQGKAYCWGGNAFGQLGNGSTDSSMVPVPVAGGLTFAAVFSGAGHTCAVTTTAQAYCWGKNTYGELGNGSLTESHVPVPVANP